MPLEKIPATVVTGFLGAGKTTLIRHLLGHAKGRRLALIVNEFGDVGVDGEILRACGSSVCTEDDIVELANGCICCTVADDFVPAMTKLLARDPPPEHIVIETSGLALPQPLVRAFNWPEIKARVTVDGVITVVDAKAYAEGRFAADEAALARQRAADPSVDHDDPIEELFEDQLACADMVILNKTDLLRSDDLARVDGALRGQVRTRTRLVATSHGALDPAVLFGLEAKTEADVANRPSHHEMEGVEQHDHDDFVSFTVVPDPALDRDGLLRRIEVVTARYEVLRLKGFASVNGSPARLLVQAVGPRVNSYFDRPWRHGEARRGELVVIGLKGIDRPAIAAAFLMHLLSVQTGVLDGGAEAVDLDQTPGEIAVLSAADSELALLAQAQDAKPRPSLRLANLLALQHNYSVDLYVEKTLSGARLIVVRLLGGAGYWPYGLGTVAALARERGIELAVMPGVAEPDAELMARGTLAIHETALLHRYLTQGGAENASRFLDLCASLIGQGTVPEAPSLPPLAGIYRASRQRGRPRAGLVFYRSILDGGQTAPIDALLAALDARGIDATALFVASLKDAESAAMIAEAFGAARPGVILNMTAFATATGGGDSPFAACDCPVLQVMLAGSSEEQWRGGSQGLGPRDLAMNVVLPELDGRIVTRAISFKAERFRHEATQCPIVTYRPVPDRVDFVADLAANWLRLRETPAPERRIAIVLANYPNRDGRIGNGVGYDTPASTIAILRRLRHDGYAVHGIPNDGNALIECLLAGTTNANTVSGDARLDVVTYERLFAELPARNREEITARWGEPEHDPFHRAGDFHLPARRFGNAVVAIQPARGYNIDPKSTYHDPALVPPHGYLAFHFWLRHEFGAHAVIHNGKHGNLEWLPGKATALSAECYPEIALGPLPQLYPFIVNDPGEGAQAKRRTSAVIVDHLTPPLTRAETYGPLKDLERLLDEYYLASGLDRRRLAALKREILDFTRDRQLDLDAGLTGDDETDLPRLDAFLCELKEAQIRDGLHILGASPDGRQETDLLVALTRVPRGLGEDADQSLIRALAGDLGLDGFDPLTCEMAESWTAARPEALAGLTPDPWRTHGDTVERLELLAARLVSNPEPAPGARSDSVLRHIAGTVRPLLRECGARELAAVGSGLDGRFVPPGASGAPTRGRLDVLPTGRNFYSIDNRTVPTPTAWNLGRQSAEDLLTRHFQDFGQYPKALGISAWGTSNMRTGGDDIAQVLALIGAKPLWEPSSWRVTGFEIVPMAALGRPRVDVTLRISGLFRDAFPAQIELLDKAIRAVAELDEDADDNPLAARVREEAGDGARHAAATRIFGSKPGAYGAGLQAPIDEKIWAERSDLARAYVVWGAYGYGARDHGVNDEALFRERLKRIEAVVHNQDNREHDLLDSDDYYQFEGGMTAAVEAASGKRPRVYHNDHSRPERPVIRTLEEEIARVVRSRVVNPKWIAGVKRHGYKGAFEIAASVDYMFAFAATTGAVKTHHFDLAYDAYLVDEETRGFLAANNPAALREIAERFAEAATRGLWSPRSNSALDRLKELAA